MEEAGAFLNSCQEGFAFEKNIGECLPESIVDCSHISTSTFQSTEGTTEEDSSTVPTSSTTESGGGSEWDKLCEGAENWTNVPHPNDCYKVCKNIFFYLQMANFEYG